MALFGSSLIALRDGQASIAVEQLTHAAKIDPSPLNFLLLAQALRQDGRSADADSASAEAQKVSPDWTEAQTSAAQILSAAGILPRH